MTCRKNRILIYNEMSIITLKTIPYKPELYQVRIQNQNIKFINKNVQRQNFKTVSQTYAIRPMRARDFLNPFVNQIPSHGAVVLKVCVALWALWFKNNYLQFYCNHFLVLKHERTCS